MGTLTPADVSAFAALCELQATLRAASQRKMALGVFDADAARLERDTATALRPYYGMFGLDPSSRARLSVPKREDTPASKWAGVLS